MAKKAKPITISITPELLDFLVQKVESGLYTSTSEIVREALRLLFKDELKAPAPADAQEKFESTSKLMASGMSTRGLDKKETTWSESH